MIRIWKGIYCNEEHEQFIDEQLTLLMNRLQVEQPGAGFDFDTSWEVCDDEFDQLDDLLRRCWNNLQGTSGLVV